MVNLTEPGSYADTNQKTPSFGENIPARENIERTGIPGRALLIPEEVKPRLGFGQIPRVSADVVNCCSLAIRKTRG